ncbi:MAG: alpha/beta hydrolase [Bacteroidales bacterium]|nr:alpha/beta hydrolase [Bacteroidales bacterium]
MTEQIFSFAGKDNMEIVTYKWLPENVNEAKGVVQIAHGMAEHAARYAQFAQFLNSHGYIVYANDHRGHGKTAKSVRDIGFFGESNGWFTVVDDMHVLTELINKAHPDLPVYIFGHSMGSLLTRTYIALYPNAVKACVLCGTTGNPGIIRYIAMAIIYFYKTVKGKRARVKLLDTMSFGAFNKKIKKPVTQFDWLSTDPEEVNKYLDDPLCGVLFSVKFFEDLLTGLEFIFKKKYIQRIPKDFPLFFISGSDDPVGEFEKGVINAHNSYINEGLRNTTLKFYKNKRHELINETNREEVYTDVLNFLNNF